MGSFAQVFADDWVSKRDAALYLRVSEQTIARLIKAGKLDGRRLSYRVVRISAASIEQFVESCKR